MIKYLWYSYLISYFTCIHFKYNYLLWFTIDLICL